MRLALGGFFDALRARPQVAALFAHEALGGTPIAVPEGITGLPEPVRVLFGRDPSRRRPPAGNPSYSRCNTSRPGAGTPDGGAAPPGASATACSTPSRPQVRRP
jgi:hypothetical protein